MRISPSVGRVEPRKKLPFNVIWNIYISKLQLVSLICNDGGKLRRALWSINEYHLLVLHRVANKPLINKSSCATRLKYCKGRRQWSVDKWKCFIWTDEWRLTISLWDGSVWVWRLSGEAPPVRMNCVHSSRMTRPAVINWYGDSGVNWRDWPAQNPAVNPIENLFRELDHRIKDSDNRLKSRKKLTCKFFRHVNSLVQNYNLFLTGKNATSCHTRTSGKHAEGVYGYSCFSCKVLVTNERE